MRQRRVDARELNQLRSDLEFLGARNVRATATAFAATFRRKRFVGRTPRELVDAVHRRAHPECYR